MVFISSNKLPANTNGIPQQEITNTSIAITSSGTLNVSDTVSQTTLSSLSTKLDILATKLDTLETTLTEIAPRRSAVELVHNGILNAYAATASVDTLGYRYMTIHARQSSANYRIDIQVQIGTGEDFFNSPTDKLDFQTINGANWAKYVLEFPSRNVRFVNQIPHQITGLYLDYTLSN